MIVAGIDIGGTNTQGVLMEGKKIITKLSLSGTNNTVAKNCFDNLLEKAGIKNRDPVKIIVTGGGSRKLDMDIFGKEFVTADEIESIGLGAIYLSNKDNLFVVSMGTGTAFVSVKNKNIEHLGGSGVGGGTLHGLSRLILNKTIDEAEKLAATGNRQNIDITVNDIIGGDLCKIPKEATAANFGKMDTEYNNEDVASSMLNMIAESIGVMSYFAAKTRGQEKEILICGRVALNDIIGKNMINTIRMFGGDAFIHENAEYCGAIGAVLSLY